MGTQTSNIVQLMRVKANNSFCILCPNKDDIEATVEDSCFDRVAMEAVVSLSLADRLNSLLSSIILPFISKL